MQFLLDRIDQFLLNLFSRPQLGCVACEECTVAQATGIELYCGLALVGLYSLVLVLLAIQLACRCRADEYLVVTEGTVFDFDSQYDESSDDAASDSTRASIPMQVYRNERMDRVLRRRGDRGAALRHGGSRQ